jgi:hypothetical protein
MKKSGIDRALAARVVSISQIALGVVVASAAGVVMMTGADPSEPPQGPLALAELLPPETSTERNPVDAEFDAAGMSDRLGVVGNAPHPIEAPVPEAPAEVPTEEPPEVVVAPVSDFAYLGQVGLGSKKLAVVSHGGSQQIVGQGDVVGPYTVIEIHHLSITVDDGGTTSEVKLKPKGSDVISRASGGPAFANAAGRPGANNANEAMRRAADAARAAQANAQQQAMKAAQMKRANSPEGYQARFDAVMERLKESGQYTNEVDMTIMAKKLLESEGVDKK